MDDSSLVKEAQEAYSGIRDSGLSIYESLAEHPSLYLSKEALEIWLRRNLIGLDLNYPLRTRSKVLKKAVAEALGYPVPASFRKVQPRFFGQNFDTYVQKSNNLQIWNEEVSAERRYVIIQVDDSHRVSGVRVVSGTELAVLDTTGTLTSKLQAKARVASAQSLLASAADTDHFQRIVRGEIPAPTREGAIPLRADDLLTIGDIYERLTPLVGSTIEDPGLDQERNRGAALHGLAQAALGDGGYEDTGQFPDIPRQLLELKLQTSPTIDLGLVSPDSREQVALVPQARHCDVRYAVFYGTSCDGLICLERVVVVTGQDFFLHFSKFGGLTVNKKRQLRLPDNFFTVL